MDCDGTQWTDVNPLLSRLTEGFLFSVLTLAFPPQTDKATRVAATLREGWPAGGPFFVTTPTVRSIGRSSGQRQ